MATYSKDLRERVLSACDRAVASRAEIARVFGVSESWIRRILQRRRESGETSSRPRRGGRRPAFDDQAMARLRAAREALPDATLAELAEAAGVICSPSAVSRALRKPATDAVPPATRKRRGPAGPP